MSGLKINPEISAKYKVNLSPGSYTLPGDVHVDLINMTVAQIDKIAPRYPKYFVLKPKKTVSKNKEGK